jgi:hypothetical protein
MDSQRKLGLDNNGNPNYGREAVDFLSHKIIIKTDNILSVRLEELFGAWKK